MHVIEISRRAWLRDVHGKHASRRRAEKKVRNPLTEARFVEFSSFDSLRCLRLAK